MDLDTKEKGKAVTDSERCRFWFAEIGNTYDRLIFRTNLNNKAELEKAKADFIKAHQMAGEFAEKLINESMEFWLEQTMKKMIDTPNQKDKLLLLDEIHFFSGQFMRAIMNIEAREINIKD
jgi:hypothetical protein